MLQVVLHREPPLKSSKNETKMRPLPVRHVYRDICEGAMRNERNALAFAEEEGKSGGEKCRGERIRKGSKKEAPISRGSSYDKASQGKKFPSFVILP